MSVDPARDPMQNPAQMALMDSLTQEHCRMIRDTPSQQREREFVACIFFFELGREPRVDCSRITLRDLNENKSDHGRKIILSKPDVKPLVETYNVDREVIVVGVFTFTGAKMLDGQRIQYGRIPLARFVDAPATEKKKKPRNKMR